MIVLSVTVSIRLFDAYSLKEKRSIVKSMLKRLHNRFNVSVAEIDSMDMLNEAVIALVTVGNQYKICEQVLQQCIKEIEYTYPVEIFQVDWERE